MIRSYHPRLRAQAAAVGVPMGDSPPILGLDTRVVHEAAKLVEARAPERERDFHFAVYRAHFVEGRNITEPGTLESLVASAGIAAADLAEAISAASYREAVIADEREAFRRRVTGVPCMWLGERPLVVGYLPPAELLRTLQAALPIVG